MALSKGDYMRPAKGLFSSSFPTMELPETTGSTFQVGEPLTIASGRVKLATSTTKAASIIGFAQTTGQALTSAATYNSTPTGVVLALQGVVFEGAVHHGTTASAIITNTDLGKTYAIRKSSTNNIWYLDKSNSSSAAGATIVGFRDSTGTSQGHVYFVVNANGRHAMWK